MVRQAIDLLEDISAQADTHRAKALTARYCLQCALALFSCQHIFPRLELQGAPRELKGHVQPGQLCKGRCEPSARFWHKRHRLSMGV